MFYIYTEKKKVETIKESDDGNGNILEERVTKTKTILYITVSHYTASEMADIHGFTGDQKAMINTLLEQDSSMWAAVLYSTNGIYGIYGRDEMLVSVALTQIGNIGGEPYWSWYGFTSRVEWCACFVSWCANECGDIEKGIIPKCAGCEAGVEWFKERNKWQDNSYVPSPGDIVFFDWDNKGAAGDQDGLADHVGIVERASDNTIFTVEGNTGDSCAERQYAVGYYEILGFGVPAY